ncbi:MAG: sigma-54-dependent Fis family transcriptional regulator [bacterium]|nr:MAG: sigma-54-dependent Fis family transcriptional regulator [bacterium]
MKIKILIVDDDIALSQEISKLLKRHHYDVQTASLLQEATEKLGNFTPEIILLDLKLPDGSGMDFLKKVRNKSPETMILILSGYGTISLTVDAIKNGALNFLTKPVDPDYLIITLEKLIEQKQLHHRLLVQELEIADRRKMVMGNSKKMKTLLEKCKTAATLDTTILLTGETGTGKQLLAHYIHQNSKRSHYPIVYVNCANLSEQLLESELFGHEKGAFTGAHRQKLGRVELAKKGTLFLDEIGEISLNLQSKLLHFIEYGEFQRLGGNQNLHSDARIICASNRDLEDEVKKGNFREDLFYRVNVINLTIAPLRERREDIPVLIQYFVSKFGQELGKPHCHISDLVVEKLCQYNWPGNVRELQNSIERAMVFCKTQQLTENDFQFFNVRPISQTDKIFKPQSLKKAIDDFKKEFIHKLLEENGGNQTKVARILEIQRTYLNRLLRELNTESS